MHRPQLDNTGRTSSQANLVVVKRLRKRRGQCVACGIRTHSMRVDPATGFEERVPMTVGGTVLNGRCLRCDPLSTSDGGGGGGPLHATGVNAKHPQTEPEPKHPKHKHKPEPSTKRRQQQQQQQHPPVSSVAVGLSNLRLKERAERDKKENKDRHRYREQQRKTSFSSLSSNEESNQGSSSVMSSGVTLKRIRERQGLCAECGRQTHFFTVDQETGMQVKQPRTVEGEVHRGRCLRCHPLPSSQSGRSKSAPRLRQGGASEGKEKRGASSKGPRLHAHGSGAGEKTSGSDHHDHEQETAEEPKRPRSILRRHSSYSGASGKGGVHHLPTITSAEESASAAKSGAVSSTKSTRSLRDGLHASSAADDDELPPTTSNQRQRATSARRIAAEKDAETEAAERLAAMDVKSADLCDIIATMRAYPKNVKIQEVGTCKLWGQSQDGSMVSAIGRAGGIPTVLDGMRSHMSSEYLAQMGCKTLENLAASEYNRRVIAGNGGFDLLSDSMAYHQRDMGVQAGGCSALSALAQSRQHCDGLDTGRMLGAIIGAVAAFPEEEHVLRCAYDGLKAFGYKPMKVLMQWQNEDERRKLGRRSSRTSGSSNNIM